MASTRTRHGASGVAAAARIGDRSLTATAAGRRLVVGQDGAGGRGAGRIGGATMDARVVTGAMAPERLDEAIRLWRGAVAPSARARPGFRGARLLVDRATGRVTSMGRWATAADRHGTVAGNQGQLAPFAGVVAAPPVVGRYEVPAEA